jgi:hypothetical protein
MNKKMRLLAVPALATSTVAVASSPATAGQDGTCSSALDRLGGSAGSGTPALHIKGT